MATEATPDFVTLLTEEHHAIDRDVDAFIDQLGRGDVALDSLNKALEALRRHIYLEEIYLFPPIQRAGLMMPVQVMMIEHGELWRTMDRIDRLVADLDAPGARDELLATCDQLTQELDRHNSKEEPVIYPRAETDLDPDTAADLADFLINGTMPEGWACRLAAA